MAGRDLLKVVARDRNPLAAPSSSRSSIGRAARYEREGHAGSTPVGKAKSSACREVWSFLPDLESGDRWFESNHADQYCCPLAHLVERRALNAKVPGSKPGGAANTVQWRNGNAAVCKTAIEPDRHRPAPPDALVARMDRRRSSKPDDAGSTPAGRAIST